MTAPRSNSLSPPILVAHPESTQQITATTDLIHVMIEQAPGRLKAIYLTLRGRAPCIAYLPALIIGESVALNCGEGSILIAMVTLILWRRLMGWCPAVLLLSFLSGLLVVQLAPPERSMPKLSEDLPFLAQIVEGVRYPRVGEVVLPLLHLQGGNRLLCKGRDLPWLNTHAIKAGDLAWITGKVSPLQLSWNPLLYDSALRRLGYNGRCNIKYISRPVLRSDTLSGRIKSAISRSTVQVLGDHESTGLLLSAALGVRDTLSIDSEQAFRRAGLSHLLVVSGYQISILFLCVAGFFRVLKIIGSQIGIGRKHTHSPFSLMALTAAPRALGVLAAFTYLWMVGSEAPLARAAIGCVVTVALLTLERPATSLHTLSVTLTILTIIWPGCFLDASVQLTFAALCGLAFGSEIGRGYSPLIKYLTVSTCATLFSGAVVLLWWGNISFAGFILNPLLAPLLSIVTCPLALLGMGAYLTGLDRGGIILKGCAWMVDVVLSTLKELDRRDLLGIDHAPIWVVVLTLVVVTAVILRVLLRAGERRVVLRGRRLQCEHVRLFGVA